MTKKLSRSKTQSRSRVQFPPIPIPTWVTITKRVPRLEKQQEEHHDSGIRIMKI
jgi:hypothetical protein